jgi:hypothetical protein
MRYGGRQKGTPNKITTELRQTLVNLVNDHLVKDIANLTPKERSHLLVRLLPYIIPSMTNDEYLEALKEPIIIVLDNGDSDEVTKVHPER